MYKYLPIVALTGLLGLTACTVTDPYYHTKSGAGVGAVTGAVIGHQLDDDHGRYYGGAAGAVIGGAVGNQMDRQRSGYERALEEQRRQHDSELDRRRNYDGYYPNRGYYPDRGYYPGDY